MSTDEPSFEIALAGLERVVDDLERGDLDLSASLARYEAGVSMLARCQALLDGVDRSVALLTGVEADGSPILAPFDASATASPVIAEPAAPAAPRAIRLKKPKSPGAGAGGGLDFDLPY